MSFKYCAQFVYCYNVRTVIFYTWPCSRALFGSQGLCHRDKLVKLPKYFSQPVTELNPVSSDFLL